MALTHRPPIITIMGHVDHGKTTLLDYIRHTRVQAGEVGGITQHIGAYNIEFNGKPITFIDTPGHAAFNKMRQRGAQITDIVVLVVAANDGVKPQTIESIRYIKESNVPFLVAINKIDLQDINVDIAKSQLAEHGVIVQSYGGDVETVEISAKTGKGVDQLLDTIQVMADLMELKADATQPLEAVVIESAKDSQRGPVASVVVQQGTLRVRQDVVVGMTEGRVRSLTNEAGQQLQTVTPGFPAEIVGLKDVPEVGSIIREMGITYPEAEAKVTLGSTQDQLGFGTNGLNLDDLLSDKQKLPLIVKTDVKGTLEAIMQNLDPDSVELIAAGVGQVTEEDVGLAETSGAVVIAFQTKVPKPIKELARTAHVKIKEYQIIYHLIEDLQKQMLKILEPTIDEVVTGEAEVLQVFEMKGERIAGIRVKTGEIKRSDMLHLKRNEEIVANPVIKSMQHGKDEILEVKSKNEAGITFKNKKLDFQVGDLLVAYKIEEE